MCLQRPGSSAAFYRGVVKATAGMNRSGLSGLILLAFLGTISRCETSISVLARPPSAPRNEHYLSNRPPLKTEALIKLPVGSVRARGWLSETLERQRQGLAGRLPEVSAWLQKEGNAWLSADGRGKWGWEEVPYWLRGAIVLAQVVDDPSLVAETEHWIEAALASQRPNGQFGPLRVFGDDDSPDLWANMLMLAAFQSYYEYSEDPRVLEMMSRYFRYQLGIPEELLFTHYWQFYRGGDNLKSVYWLYNHTGEEWLLELAEKIHRNTANWRTRGDLPSWHGVNIAQAFGEPATFYLQSGDPLDLKAAYDNFHLVRERYGQFPGGMFAADENARTGYTDPRQAIETCAVVEQIRSDQQLLITTGDAFWADHLEEVAYNTYPAAFAPDYRSLRYLTSPNQVSSDSRNYSPGIENIGPMFTFNPLSHRCCQHNHALGWPGFVECLWTATHDNGLCAAYYGPSAVEAVVGEGVAVRIEETTRYPFEERIVFKVSPESNVAFPLYLKVPAWSKRTAVAVNDSVVADDIAPSAYVRIHREWRPGDRVTLRMPMDVEARRWRESHDSVSIVRGPLAYSLRIESEKRPVDPVETIAIDSQWRDGLDPAEWPAFELHPKTPWNYGLVLDQEPIERNFVIEARDWPESNYPFEPASTPVSIKCKGRRIPEWTRDSTGMCGRLQQSPVYSSRPVEPITLIPMGAALLRITAFPEASDDRDQPVWRTLVNARLRYRPSASYCARDDEVSAMADGLLPCASNDQAIPRHTFLPRTGSKEWLQADFDEPREIDRVSLYWCDDASRYDHAPTGDYSSVIKGVDCRAPASWKLLYRDGAVWKSAETNEPYGVRANQFNTVRIAKVRTTALRIEVQLPAGASSGVLEWRVGSGQSVTAPNSGSDRAGKNHDRTEAGN